MEVVITVTSLLPWLRKPHCIMLFLFTVEISDMIQVLASYAVNVGIEPEWFQAHLCSFYLVTKYLVDKPQCQ